MRARKAGKGKEYHQMRRALKKEMKEKPLFQVLEKPELAQAFSTLPTEDLLSLAHTSVAGRRLATYVRKAQGFGPGRRDPPAPAHNSPLAPETAPVTAPATTPGDLPLPSSPGPQHGPETEEWCPAPRLARPDSDLPPHLRWSEAGPSSRSLALEPTGSLTQVSQYWALDGTRLLPVWEGQSRRGGGRGSWVLAHLLGHPLGPPEMIGGGAPRKARPQCPPSWRGRAGVGGGWVLAPPWGPAPGPPLHSMRPVVGRGAQPTGGPQP